MSFQDRDEAAKLTSKARNLPQNGNENNPRFVTYVDPRARKRYNAIQIVAKTIRTKSKGTIQTSIRNGKHDYLLRQKQKGDQTPWSQIPPVKLDLNLPEFEVGKYKNIYEEKEEDIPEGDRMEDEEEEDDQQELSNEIIRQYELDEQEAQINKRNLTSTTNTPPTKHKRRKNIQPGGSGAEADTESDSGSQIDRTKSYMHSTLRDTTPQKTIQWEAGDSKTVPETPDIPKFITRYHSEIIQTPANQKNNMNTKKNTVKEIVNHHV